MTTAANSVELKFYPADWNTLHNVSLAIAGNDKRCNVVLDTGSTGIVLGDAFRPAGATKLNNIPAPSYSSSGNTYEGNWYSVAVNFFQPNAQTPVASTTEIPVFFATDKTPFMMGVGIGRNYDNSFNPFLNLTSIEGQSAITQGYVLRNTSVSLGLTPALEEPFTSVMPVQDLQATATLTLDGKTYDFTAPLLVDTGITNSILNNGFTGTADYPAGFYVPGSSTFQPGTVMTLSGPIDFSITQGVEITVPRPGGNGTMALTETGRFGYGKGGGKIINSGASPLRNYNILVIGESSQIGFCPAS